MDPDGVEGPPAVRLALKVVPGASRERIVGPHAGALKVMVAQPPEGGAANKAVCRLLARLFGVPAAQVEIMKGHTSPLKSVRLVGLTVEQARQRLAAAGDGG